jgi:hypothetical protein
VGVVGVRSLLLGPRGCNSLGQESPPRRSTVRGPSRLFKPGRRAPDHVDHGGKVEWRIRWMSRPRASLPLGAPGPPHPPPPATQTHTQTRAAPPHPPTLHAV